MDTNTFKVLVCLPAADWLRLTGSSAAQLLLRGGRVRRGRVRLGDDLFGKVGGKHSSLAVQISLPPALLHLSTATPGETAELPQFAQFLTSSLPKVTFLFQRLLIFYHFHFEFEKFQ